MKFREDRSISNLRPSLSLRILTGRALNIIGIAAISSFSSTMKITLHFEQSSWLVNTPVCYVSTRYIIYIYFVLQLYRALFKSLNFMFTNGFDEV